ncbi:MAG: hypothetical protein DSZ03_06560 [Sulfurimonas sp.]|nr:MAG: hypothetical protein DSZ03_06560 [Sulfurimonas sp.]
MKTLGVLLLFLVIMTGCAATQTPKTAQPEAEKVVLSNKLQFHNLTFKLHELVDVDATYHTQAELQAMVQSKLQKLLEAKHLLTDDPRANTLVIKVNYERRFVGDKTPIPSNALAYPSYGYRIDVMDGDTLLTSIVQDTKNFRGGLAMSKQVVTKSLNDKRYENTFINAVVKDIFKSIESLF